ncbi:hypothetical protein DARTUKUTA_30 [Bacillus phage vB_BspP_Dartukuta]|nr:hypothetical protein DARTUKUTA_30 [Bacillus phage vB_BspP_Dartukuta]
MKLLVNSQDKLAEAISSLQRTFADKKYLTIQVKTGRDRTLDQNALWFAMYKRIAQAMEWHIDEARRHCKLHFGVPLMRNECAEFRQNWNELLLHLSYEKKLELMGANPLLGPDGFPVTRLFNRAQGIEYTNRIVDDFREQGVFFDDLLKDEQQ